MTTDSRQRKNLRGAFEEAVGAIDNVVPRLAGSLVAHGKVAEYRQVLETAKQLRTLMTNAIHSGELDDIALTFGDRQAAIGNVDNRTGSSGDVTTTNREHRRAIHNAVDGMLESIDQADVPTRQRVAAAYVAIDESIEQLVKLTIERPSS